MDRPRYTRHKAVDEALIALRLVDGFEQLPDTLQNRIQFAVARLILDARATQAEEDGNMEAVRHLRSELRIPTI